MIIENVNINPLLKAFKKFEQFQKNLSTEQEKAGAIQAFEYCFELSWKVMKKILFERGKTANSPKEAFRMAALEGFIDDPEVWFDFLKKRNLTTRTYEDGEAEIVIAILPTFSIALQSFLKKIRAKNLVA